MRINQKLVDEINEVSKNIKTLSENDNLRVYDIYADVIVRFKNIDKSCFIDTTEYKMFLSYCDSSETLWNLELKWLKEQSNLAVGHNYLQITEGLKRMLTMLYILRYN